MVENLEFNTPLKEGLLPDCVTLYPNRDCIFFSERWRTVTFTY